MTTAAHIQLAVLVHHRVITRDFSSGGAFAVDDGFSSVVYCGIVARNNELTVVIILPLRCTGNDSNLLIVFYVQIMPDDFVMQ
ncbi:hypothetical protein, partial [Escherichia coli]|uniref:hypothetical protein n=1 Tax=Escherichia coli TaxID=562 RepID=UPI0021BBF41A